MSNSLVQTKATYIKELQNQMNSKPSKIAQYKEKLNEREMYAKDNMFDYFGRAGGGAPLKADNGSVKTTRRTLLNNNYEELMSKNNENYSNNNNNYKQQQQQHFMRNPSAQMNHSNSQMNFQPQQQVQQYPPMQLQDYIQKTPMNQFQQPQPAFNYYGDHSPNIDFQFPPNRAMSYRPPSQNAFMSAQPYQTPISNQRQMQPPQQGNNPMTMQNTFHEPYQPQSQPMQQPPRRPISTRAYHDIPNGGNNNNNDNGIVQSILPQEKPNTDKLEIQKKILKEDWLIQIEEKKKRENEEKKKEEAKDLKEEIKWKQFLEEQKRKEKEEAKRKADETFAVQNINSMMTANKNKAKQLVSLEPNEPMNNQPQQSLQPQQMNYNQEDYYPIMPPQQHQQQQQFQPVQQLQQQISPIEGPHDQYSRMINMNYANLGRNLDDNVHDEIAKLRNDVRTQYVEMSSLFGKLKMDVVEANQLKAEAERELQYIRDELLKQKMQNILYDTKLNHALEKNAPYNNMHIPFKEVDPLYNAYNKKPQNLKSTSSMVYANDIVNEKVVHKVKQLSSLAQVGQSLVGESEFVPIHSSNNTQEDDYENKENRNDGQGINNNNIGIGTGNFPNINNGNSYTFKGSTNHNNNNNNNNTNNYDPNDNQMKVLDSYMKNGDYQDMYSKLCDIADINHQMDPYAKSSIPRNNSIPINMDKILSNTQNNADNEIQKLDAMLNQIVDNTNQYEDQEN